MFPQLTKEQITASRVARNNANLPIRASNKRRAEDAAKMRRYGEADLCSEVRGRGLPVVLTLEGIELVLDYDLVLALQRKLPAKQWRVRADCRIVRDRGVDRSQLRVHYEGPKKRGGCVLFYELPEHQLAALDRDKLPTVDLDAADERTA